MRSRFDRQAGCPSAARPSVGNLSEMPQSDYQSRNVFQAFADRMTENFAYPIQKGRYRSDVGMCSIESFTKPIGIKGLSNLPVAPLQG